MYIVISHTLVFYMDVMFRNKVIELNYNAQWLRGRASNSQLREPGFESCAAVLKP